MNKKAYMKPAMRVVKIQHQSYILAGSGNVTSTGGNSGIGYGGGGSGNGRSRFLEEFDNFDEDVW